MNNSRREFLAERPGPLRISGAWTYIAACLLTILAADASVAEPFYVKGGNLESTLAASMAKYHAMSPGKRAKYGLRTTLSAWQMAGPFTGAEEEVFNHRFPPEKIAPASLLKELAEWKNRPEWVDGEVIALPRVEHAAFYLYREIQSPNDRRLKVSLGCDDGIKVWLNGQELLSRNVFHYCQPNQEHVELPLRRGVNHLLMKIHNGVLDSGFYFKATDEHTNDPVVETIAPMLKRDFPSPADREFVDRLLEDNTLFANTRVRRYDFRHRAVRFVGPWRYSLRGSPDNAFSMRTDKPGAYVEMTFLGDGVSLSHKNGTIKAALVLTHDSETLFGAADITIDGKSLARLDTSGPTPSRLADDLPFGRHTVRAILTDEERPPANIRSMGFMSFETSAGVGDATGLARMIRHFIGSVQGGDGWMRQAAALARRSESRATLESAIRLYRRSGEFEALADKLHRFKATHNSPMFERERRQDFGDDARAYTKRLNELKAEAEALTKTGDAMSEPYDSLIRGMSDCVARFEELQRESVAELPPILFVKRHAFNGVGASMRYMWEVQPTRWGCSLNVAKPGKPHRTIFSDPNGSIQNINLSFDAKTVFFAGRLNREKYWHLYQVGVDGKGLQQLTHGNHFNVSPTPLRDGRIAFISSRARFTHNVCQSGPSLHLHVMNQDGADVRDLSMNTLSDFTPTLLPDGRILYTRWEYVDSDLSYRQSLWTQNPDGTNYQLYFGNTIIDPATFWQARAIPGRREIVCTLAPHHGTPHGAIGLIDNSVGVEAPRGEGFRWITLDFPSIDDSCFFWSYRDPYPVNERQFLVSYGGENNRFAIWLMDDVGNKTPAIRDNVFGCYSAMPLRPRECPPVISSKLPARAPVARIGGEDIPTGTLVVKDIYQGLMPYVKRGEVKYIRVMEQLPKTTERYWHKVYDQGPLMSAATYYAKRCWGTVPVAADGSAHFEIPARKEIYLQALDSEQKELQRQTSALMVMPGEILSCVGCHEDRNTAPPANMRRPPIAAGKPATPITPPEWGNNGIIDYNKLVQPVLDKHCVECHGGANPKGGLLLTGDRTRFFSVSYDNLVVRSRSLQHSTLLRLGEESPMPLVQVDSMFPGLTGPVKPLTTGSRLSRLVRDHIDTDHCGHEIPFQDRLRVTVWIEALAPYYPTSDNARPSALGGRDAWARPDSQKLADWFELGFEPVYNRRCATCHGAISNVDFEWSGRYAWLNLSNPEISPALAAHLSKESGGRGLTENDFPKWLKRGWEERRSDFVGRWLDLQKHHGTMRRTLGEGKKVQLFQSKNDPDYRTMLEAINEGKKQLFANPRADMPGFVAKSLKTHFDYDQIRSELSQGRR